MIASVTKSSQFYSQTGSPFFRSDGGYFFNTESIKWSEGQGKKYQIHIKYQFLQYRFRPSRRGYSNSAPLGLHPRPPGEVLWSSFPWRDVAPRLECPLFLDVFVVRWFYNALLCFSPPRQSRHRRRKLCP